VRRWLRLVLLAGGGASVAGVVGFAAGAAITDRLEQDNRFCIACHRPEKPLHANVYGSFYLVDGILLTLAGAHNAQAQVKCIDCHIGVTRKDDLIIKAIAAWDTARWVIGAYKDPETLRYPLGDRTCLKCHPDGGQNPKVEKAFHNAPYHRDPRNSCSHCHRSHLEAPAETRFLRGAIVKPLCDQCHRAILGIPAR
jgi:hypothetical protein